MADKFLRGAMILTMAGLMVKILGSVNRILLSRFLGGEGIGLYQMAYPVFLLMLSVSSAGIPIAISIIVSEKVAKGQFKAAEKVFKISLGLMVVTGICFAALLYFGAGWLVESGFVRDPRAYYGLVALTPAVFFSTILASFRGYFQGYQMMEPPAVSQILEQFTRVVTMIALAYFLLPYGLEYAAAGAAFGAVPGAVTGLIVLSFFYRRLRKNFHAQPQLVQQEVESVGAVAKRLALLALPVSCANIMVPVTSSIDMLLVPNCLYASGYAIEEATTLFGYLTGMGMPLVMMATIVTLSLAAGIVPAISEAHTLGDTQTITKKSRMAMNICCLITLPAAAGLWVLATPIAQMIYNAPQAGDAIRHLAPSACLLGIHQVTTGMLQGIGKTAIPMWNMLLSAVVKIGAVMLLTVTPLNIVGAAWASNINFGLAATLNIFFLLRNGITFDVKVLGKLLAASLLMAGCASLVYGFANAAFGNTVATIATILAAIVVYAALLFALKAVSKDDLEKIPFIGSKIKRR